MFHIQGYQCLCLLLASFITFCLMTSRFFTHHEDIYLATSLSPFQLSSFPWSKLYTSPEPISPSTTYPPPSSDPLDCHSSSNSPSPFSTYRNTSSFALCTCRYQNLSGCRETNSPRFIVYPCRTGMKFYKSAC